MSSGRRFRVEEDIVCNKKMRQRGLRRRGSPPRSQSSRGNRGHWTWRLEASLALADGASYGMPWDEL